MKLADIYAKLPGVLCKGLCHASCGIVPIAPAERRAIEGHTGRRVRVLSDSVMGIPENHRVLRPRDPDDLTCPYLKSQRCSIHPVRPLVCRMYGVVEGMPCPHGCTSSLKPLTDTEAEALVDEIARIK